MLRPPPGIATVPAVGERDVANIAAARETAVVEYVIEKWGGRPHCAGTVRYLGDDEFGIWLWGPAGRSIYRGGAPLFVTAQDMLSVVPGAWWTPAWWLVGAFAARRLGRNEPPFDGVRAREWADHARRNYRR
jgi:hypothetical protein